MTKTTNPVYGPCPLRDGKPVIKMINSGDECLFCSNKFNDGQTVYLLPCNHVFCGSCIRAQRNITLDGFWTLGGFADTLRCHCGRLYTSIDFRNAKPARCLLRNHVIELTDDYVAVKEEPIENV